jgi:hypothetical protein
MKRWMWISAAPAAVLVTMLATSRGQPAPTPAADGQAAPTTRQAGDFRVKLNEERGPRGDRGPGEGHGPGDERGPGDGPPEGRFGGPDGPRGMGGPGGMGPMGMRRPPSVDVMRNYLELVDRYAAMSSDPIKAGVGAVITAADLLRAQGNDAAIKYFEGMLADTEHRPAAEVKRAIRLQLAELYKADGKSDKALETLKAVIQGLD